MRAYTDALIREMSHYAQAAEGVCFDTVFFGGGTPSLLPLSDIIRLLNAARALFCFAPHAEITLEANPATADEKKLFALLQAGINRLSVGVQSLSDEELRYLGRVHRASDAMAFLKSARRAGFENINVDLMYGIPAQTVQSAEKTLSEVLSFSPDHVSAYSLMLEEGTPLYENRASLPIPTEDEEIEIDALVSGTLAAHGYLHYEISNYAKEGRESRHNLHYWHSDPYLGFGVSAYSFFGGERYGNHADLHSYVQDPLGAVSDWEHVSEKDLAYEWIMLRLRLREGLSLSEYRSRFGVDLKQRYFAQIREFLSKGLMQEKDGRIFLTEQGFRLSNSILVAFLEDEKNS